MARNGIVVRTAGPDDLEDLVRLADRALATMSDPRLATAKTASETQGIAELLDNPDARLLVACLADGSPAGVALLSIDIVSRSLGGLTMSSVIMVDKAARHRGVGRELVCAIARYADEAGADAVTVALPSGDREAHRFYARLGFSSLWTSRIASVPQLMRALAPSDIAAERRHKVLLRARRPFRRQTAMISGARIAATTRLGRQDS